MLRFACLINDRGWPDMIVRNAIPFEKLISPSYRVRHFSCMTIYQRKGRHVDALTEFRCYREKYNGVVIVVLIWKEQKKDEKEDGTKM